MTISKKIYQCKVCKRLVIVMVTPDDLTCSECKTIRAERSEAR